MIDAGWRCLVLPLAVDTDPPTFFERTRGQGDPKGRGFPTFILKRSVAVLCLVCLGFPRPRSEGKKSGYSIYHFLHDSGTRSCHIHTERVRMQGTPDTRFLWSSARLRPEYSLWETWMVTMNGWLGVETCK